MIHNSIVSPQPSNLPVLVGIDGSSASELATEIAFDEASQRESEVVATRVERADVSSIPSMEWSAPRASPGRRP